MRKFKIVSFILYLFVAIITLAMSTRFLIAKEYFVYHAQASGISWVDVNPGLQTVFLALFKVCGAGFLAVAISLILMIIFPFAKFNHRWSFYTIPVCGIIFWSIIFATTLYVTLLTPANAPWIPSLINIILFVAGYVFSMLDRTHDSTT